jgi:hypothetical protein
MKNNLKRVQQWGRLTTIEKVIHAKASGKHVLCIDAKNDDDPMFAYRFCKYSPP